MFRVYFTRYTNKYEFIFCNRSIITYISGKINRLDFEVGKDMPLAVVENSVLLQADLEFVKN